MSEPVLQVKGLKTYYYTEEGVVPAVDGLDFEVEPGETFAIVGESGCGKSVTSLSILRLIPSPPGKIIDGEIIYHGQDLVKKSEREMRSIRGNDISMIFQEPMTSLNPVFTVGQQIGESFRFHQQMGKAEMLKKSIEMLRLVGIPEPEHVINDYPNQLSGGMAPARYDCHGAGVQPENPDCGRTNDRAGRDDSGTDYAPAEAIAGEDGHIHHSYHA